MVAFVSFMVSARYTVARALGEEGGEEEEEEEENLHESMPVVYVSTIVAILSFLIAVSVFFEIAKETIEEEVSPELKPMLTSLFGELTVLGFIGIVLFFTFKLQFIQDLNTSLYKEENAINEMSETVHMALFLVMIIFLGTDLILVRAGTYVEAGWRKQREDLFDVEKTNTSKLILRERRNNTTTWSKLVEGFSGHAEVEQAVFAYIRQRLFRQKEEVGVRADTFDMAQYLAGVQGHVLAELVEIPTTTFGLIECLIIVFAIFTLQCEVTTQIIFIVCVAYAIPVVLHLIDFKCRAMLVDVCGPEIEADLANPLTPNAYQKAPVSGSLNSQSTQAYQQVATEKSAMVEDNVDAHVARFWLGTCTWWPFSEKKNGEEEWGYDYMLGLVRKCLLMNSIYVTVMTVSYGHVLFRFMSGENGAGEPLEAEGERRLGEEEPKHDDSHWSPQFSMLILFVAWVPVFVTLFKLVNVSKNFVMVASIESYTNNRMVLLVMRRVQTRSAFLALKLTEIMKRPKLMKAAARADSSNVEPITVFERMAYRKIFDEFDDDKGGSVTHEELTTFLETTNPDLKHSDVNEIVELLDDDNSGDIDFDEFIVFISKVVFLELSEKDGNHEIVKGMFARVDDDGSGEICVEELCTYLRIYFKDMSVDDTYALIGDFGIDEDGSGNLDVEEFELLCKKLKIFNSA